MIVQCAQCSSKFRLDDAKVTEAGIKVRCSKCKKVFVVRKEAPAEEPDYDQLLQGLDANAAVPSVAAPVAAVAAGGFQLEREAAVPPAPVSGGEAPQGVASGVTLESSQPSGREEAGGFEWEGFAGGEDAPLAESSPTAASFGFDLDAFAAGTQEPPSPVAAVSGEQEGHEVSPEETPATETPASVDEGAMLFGDVSPESFAATMADAGVGMEAGALGPEISFEFEEDETGAEEGAPGAETIVEEPFDFGEIDLGLGESTAEATTEAAPTLVFSDLAVPSAEPVSGVQSTPALSAPQPAEPQLQPLAVPFGEDELPPLTIPSRRKGRSVLAVAFIAVCVLMIVVLAGGGFYFFKEGPAAFDKLGIGFVADWFGLSAKEEGSIGVDKVRGAFLTNGEAGELFVIRGEAVNNFRKPRASIQIRGAVTDAKGQVLSQKVAYCGNQLSDEQLKTLPLAKIEAAMGNQFGDSLANLGVQPGARIPFVIALANVPREAVDFIVEVAGSTVASP